MKKLLTLLLVVFLYNGYGQTAPRIIIDIPTSQKPWNNLDWNRSESQFQFAIVTDRTGGHRPGVFPMGIKKLNLLQPEFVMSVGDLIEGYTKDTARLYAEWREFKSFIDPLESPFFYLPGNHDITNKVMGEVWEDIFGVSYYHFVYNDVLFLCLNSEDNYRGSGRGTIDDEQYEYIQKTLAENKDVKWTMVFIHQPLWVQEDTKRWKDVENLLSERQHYVFAGHYHRYWKTNRNKGNYIALATTGGWSPLRGRAYGEFDHVVWVTMTEEGPILANLFLDGIWDEDVVTEDLVDLVRNKPFPVKIQPAFVAENNPTELSTTVRITNDADVKMSVNLTGKIQEGYYYELGETELAVEPNDVKKVTLKLSNPEAKDLTGFQPVRIQADITYAYENKPQVSFSDELRYAPNIKFSLTKSSKINVDGNLKEWKGEWIEAAYMEGKPFDFDGKEDCQVQFATQYDEENLYIAMDITDEEVYINETGSVWNQDAIVLGIDGRDVNTSAFNQGQGRGSDWIAYLRSFKSENPVYDADRLPVNIQSEFKRTSKGLQVEVAVPLTYLKKMQGEDWKTVRLGIGYYDYDENGEESTTHGWFPAWNSAEDIPGSGMMYRE